MERPRFSTSVHVADAAMHKTRHPKNLPSEDEDSGRGSVDSSLLSSSSSVPSGPTTREASWVRDLTPTVDEPWAAPVTDGPADYENVSSPCASSTESGPIYVRPPGFDVHGHSVRVKATTPRVRRRHDASESREVPVDDEGDEKKLNTTSKKVVVGKKSVISVGDLSAVLNDGRCVSTRVRAKPKREPLPMKMRALPQSFWQQPDQASEVSPAGVAPVLPSLFKRDPQEDISEVRPVTPPGASGTRRYKSPERIVRVKNTDLLMRLFDGVDPERRPTAPAVKRGRPKKTAPTVMSRSFRGEDPCMVNAATEALLPLLPFGQNRGHRGNPTSSTSAAGPPSLTLVTLRDGDKTVSLPALSVVDHNYPQMLSELVMRL